MTVRQPTCTFLARAALNPYLSAPIVKAHDTDSGVRDEFFVCESAACDPAQHAEWTSLTDWATKRPQQKDSHGSVTDHQRLSQRSGS